jgi:broad specificity phosphatase PhoE
MHRHRFSTLLLARHGQTADNANLVFQGQTGRGLDARGRAQAGRLAERLRRWPPDALYASDLERAIETAEIVGEACGLVPRLDRDLREVDVGTWSGKSHDEIASLYPEEWAAWSAGLDARRGGGETYAELAARVEGALARIAAEHAEKRVVVVTHGGAIKSFIAKILGVSGEGRRALLAVANAGLTVVELDPRGRARLGAWNDTAHLEGMEVEDETD